MHLGPIAGVLPIETGHSLKSDPCYGHDGDLAGQSYAARTILVPDTLRHGVASLVTAQCTHTQHVCAPHTGRMRIGFGTLIHWLTVRLMHSPAKMCALDIARAVWGLAQSGVTNPAVLGTFVHRLPVEGWSKLSCSETVMLLSGCSAANGACTCHHCVSSHRYLEKRKQAYFGTPSACFRDPSVDRARGAACEQLHRLPRSRRPPEHVLPGIIQRIRHR